ncbi:E3 ubiquitin-protein ligase CCNB1IP1 [Favolaschia claudopus]|uniref:E3 ubiquitin-protein ligase CCNB1IP1 n=1 Tax=Favolaschia claudopus TaxID=2862362 RepID=A0AAW0EBA9_9AGAR
MDTDLKCNRLTCRRPLNDKAVVVRSHIFCVDCANELFNAARLCPGVDDVVVCSLHPSNDYKTSVLSGLTPLIILEICSRAISFWQYQTHQENSFQQAVVRNVNDKNAQLQKQLENVIREANSEINLLSNKNAELERDLELERRKVRDLQEAAREQDKEYQKLKAQHEKIKRKTLLAPNAAVRGVPPVEHNLPQNRLKAFTNPVALGAVVGGMEANGIHRTPLVNRTAGPGFTGPSHNGWNQHPLQPPPHHQHSALRTQSHRQPFAAPNDRGYQSGHTSDHSAGSAHEVENMLLGGQGMRTTANHGWSTAPTPRSRPPKGLFDNRTLYFANFQADPRKLTSAVFFKGELKATTSEDSSRIGIRKRVHIDIRDSM